MAFKGIFDQQNDQGKDRSAFGEDGIILVNGK